MPNKHTSAEVIATSKTLLATSGQLRAQSADIIAQNARRQNERKVVPTIRRDVFAMQAMRPFFADGTSLQQGDGRRHVRIVNSWKEIAIYLRQGVRTVQRWELEHSLPVRRPRLTKGSAVIALKSELDQWLLTAAVGYVFHGDKAGQLPNLAMLEGRLLRLRREAEDVEGQIKQLKRGVSAVSPPPVCPN